MKIFITSAHAFVGRNLTEYLSRTAKYTLFIPKSSEFDLLNENAVYAYVDSNHMDIIIHEANRSDGCNTAEMSDVVHV